MVLGENIFGAILLKIESMIKGKTKVRRPSAPGRSKFLLICTSALDSAALSFEN